MNIVMSRGSQQINQKTLKLDKEEESYEDPEDCPNEENSTLKKAED